MLSEFKVFFSFQITERIIVLFVVINSQEEVQGKYVVCVLFFLWNLLDVVRYTYNMLARMGIYYLPLTWLNFSMCIPLYPLSVLAKGKEVEVVSTTCFLNILQKNVITSIAICV